MSEKLNSNSVVCISIDKDAFDLMTSFKNLTLLGYFDKIIKETICSVSYLGGDEDWEKFLLAHSSVKYIMLLDSPKLKKRLVSHYGENRLQSIVAQDAYIASSVLLDEGVFIQRGVKIMPDVQIGKVVKINMNVTLHHDVTVGDYSTLAPSCTILGNAKIGSTTFVGAGAIILPHVKIGNNVVIGAGAVVTCDVPNNTVYVGVPAKPLKKELP